MKSRSPQSIFLWQALLIAAPVVALSAFALFSLRLDRASVLEDAGNDAANLVPALARQCSEAIAEAWVRNAEDQNHAVLKPRNGQLKHRILEGLVSAGTVLAPIDYPPVPSPPAWPQQMNAKQEQLWVAFEEAVFKNRDPATGRGALAALKFSGVAEEAIANAELNLLLLEKVPRGTPEMARRLTSLARNHRRAATPSGTPAADIALLRALQYADRQFLDEVLLEVSGRMKSYPSFLSADLLSAAERARPGEHFLRNQWSADEEARGLLRAFLKQYGQSEYQGELWFTSDGRDFLALCSPGSGQMVHIALIPGQWLEDVFSRTLHDSRIPEYAVVELQIGSRSWRAGSGINPVTQTQTGELLASASGRINVSGRLAVPLVAINENLSRLSLEMIGDVKSPPGGDIHDQLPLRPVIDHPFTTRMVMSDVGLLYARHRQRLWLSGGFILLATAAAGLGLWSAWRGFQRQARLAEMTSNFVSSVSHELRAPLASVRLMAESLDQGRVAEGEKQKGYFRLIVQECRRLSSLVENVLDFSRIQQKRRSYEFETVDAAALIGHAVQLMMPAAEEHHVSLDLIGCPGPLQPCWDGLAVQQAVVNLIDNAIKHSPPGSAVEVGYEAVENTIRIQVDDRGPGIPEQEHERIFEPFYRRGTELRRETRGIGIGLSLVKHVAEGHGGRVIVESTPGRGSVFTLELPDKTEARE